MASSKLLFVFALAALSIGASIPVKKVDSQADVPKHDNEGIYWNSKFSTWDKDGLLKDTITTTNDYTKGYSLLKKKKVLKNQDEEQATQLISDEDIGTLKAGRAHTLDERGDYSTKCAAQISIPFSALEQIGYTANVLDNDHNFLPSYLYNIQKSPKKRYINGYDEKIQALSSSSTPYDFGVNAIYYKYEQEYDANCHRGGITSYVDASRYNYGVVDEACYPNDFSKIKGWDQARPLIQQDWVNGTSAIIEDKCTGTGDFKAYFKKYSFGDIYLGNLTTLQRAIVRYGPVQVSGYHLRADSASTSTVHPGFTSGGSVSGLIIGWNDTALINIVNDYGYDEQGVYVHKGKKRGDGFPLKYETGLEGAKVSYPDLLFESIRVFGSGVSAVRAALSVIAAAVVLPALALFF